MNFDISHLLDQWDYQPGQVVVRRFTGKDGVEKIQLRVDLGLLQMNVQGRPDGKRPLGHPSLFDHYQARLQKYRLEHDSEGRGFVLRLEDCSRLQIEALQYHHRYICLLQLEDHAGVIRDTERNLAVFDFVQKYAETEELAWQMLQFKPQLLMVHTRAKAAEFLRSKDYLAAMEQIEAGITRIQAFYREHSRSDLLEQSGELTYLRNWLGEISSQRPLSKREELEKALNEAVNNEDYEKAARMRDALRNLKTTSSHGFAGTTRAGDQGRDAREGRGPALGFAHVEVRSWLCADRAQNGEPSRRGIRGAGAKGSEEAAGLGRAIRERRPR